MSSSILMAVSCFFCFISTVTMLLFILSVFLCASSNTSVYSYSLFMRVSICLSISPLFS